MATITLVANTSYSSLTVADGDTIDLAGFRLTFDVNPAQENVIVHSPGTGGTVDLPQAISVFDFPGWEFTAGTANLLPSVALTQTVGGTWVGGVGGHAITTNHGTITGSVRGSATTANNGCGTNNGDVQGQIIGGGIPGAYGIQANNGIVTGSVSPDVGPGIRFHYGAAIGPVSPGGISQYRNHTLICNGPVWEDATSSPYNKVILSLFGPLHPNATVAPGTEVIVLSGDVAAAIANGQRPNQPTRITPGVAPRLSFVVLDSDGVPVQDLAVAGITSAVYITITGGVRSSASTITLGSKVADTASHSTGQLVTIRPSEGWYAIDAPAGAALSTADYAELVITLADSSRLVYPTMHPIDASVSDVPADTRTELATELARIDVAVSTRNAVTPPTVAQLNARTLLAADYFAPSTDTVARVTLVDTTTANTDMRGTNGANTTTPPTAASIATAVWAAGTRTLTAISDSSGITTLLSRITGLLETKSEADSRQAAILDAIGDPVGPNTVTITVVDDDSNSPIEGALVRLYRTGASGTSTTNADGEAEFTVVDATWSIAVAAGGYSGNSGVIVVPGELAKDVRLTASSFPSTGDPDTATLRVTCYGADTQVAPGAIVRIRQCTATTGFTGGSMSGETAEKIADSNGIVDFTVFKNAGYEMQRGTSLNWVKVKTNGDDNQYAPSFVGMD